MKSYKQDLEENFKGPFIWFGCKREKDEHGVYLSDEKQPKDITKEWRVFYYFKYPDTHRLTGKYKRFEIRSGINYKKTLETRYIQAVGLKLYWLRKLQNGYNPFADPTRSDQDEKSIHTLKDALLKALEIKKEHGSWQEGVYEYYQSTLNVFLKQAEKSGHAYLMPAEVTRKMVKRDLDALCDEKTGKKLGNSRYNYIQWLISDLFNWMLEGDILTASPLIKMRNKAKEPQEKYVPLTKKELTDIYEYLIQVNVPYLAYLTLVYSCGARPQELLRLRRGNFDFKRRLVRFEYHRKNRTSKGRKERYVALTDETIELMLSYGAEKANPDDYMFSDNFVPGEQKKDRNYGRKPWDKYVKGDLKIDKNLYGLKYTGGAELKKRGVKTATIKEIWAHSDEKITEGYIPDRQAAQIEVLEEYRDKLPTFRR